MFGDEAARYLERQRQCASSVISSSSAHRRALKEGEWACVDAKCAFINTERTDLCERCGKGKPRSKNRVGREIGKDAAEKSKGLFSAEDWACTKCGNVNWARRTACNICNAPKLGDLEVRTGYGGGYMDRQNVEYIERKDDDEFDEFGRKKKRKRAEELAQTDALKTKTEDEEDFLDEKGGSDEYEVEEKEEQEEIKYIDEKGVFRKEIEEEEDIEENDGHLDKYDLSADELEVEDLKAKIAARKAALAAANTSPSRYSSDCSCSCSGGECSCEESESEEERKWKTPRIQEASKVKENHERGRELIRENEKARDRDREKDKDRERDRRSSRDRREDRYSRRYREDSRSRYRHAHSPGRDRR